MIVETKLEIALRNYVANHWQAGTSLAGVALAEGHTSSVQDNAERIVFDVGDRGGPLVDQGNYELPVEIVVITSAHLAEGEEADGPIHRHAERAEEIIGIFSQARQGDIITALQALDAELGISGYWPLEKQFGRRDANFVTAIPFIFHCHLAQRGVLAVTPTAGLVSIGEEGGPFSPSSKVYTLENTGDYPLTWAAQKATAWLTLSATGGTLAADATTTVTVTINSAADDLAEDSWLDTVTFSNADAREQQTTRGVGLLVGTGGTVTRKTGSYTISNGASSFEIAFAEAFGDVPAFADVNILPASGQAAIAVRKITRAADKLTVELDTATPTAGYVANWFAILE